MQAFEAGQIVYFTPFYFKNGNPAKTKYFLALKTIDEKVILASLPSSKDYVPSDLEINITGCIDDDSRNFNCFTFTPNLVITDNGKSFPLKTFLYGFYLDEYDLTDLSEMYPIEGVDYELWGRLLPEYFQQVINCFKNSKVVKRKYKKVH